MNAVQRMIQEEIRKLNLDDKNRSLEASLEAKQQALRDELEQMRRKAEADRIGGSRAMEDLLKIKAFESKVTPVPPQEQLTVLERDQLDFFLKSPGIGMLFLSKAFYLSKTDLGGQLKSAAAKALGSEVTSTISAEVPVGTNVRRMSDAALKKVTGEKEDGDSKDDDHGQQFDESNHSSFDKLLKPARICLTIAMPLLLFGVQFAYIFFIFKEGYDNYSSGVCPGYDVPGNTRHDPGFGADTQVRILVGFIGAYFVFKNISQLISYQRALRGNTQLNIPTAAAAAPKAPGLIGDVVSAVSAVQSAVTGLNKVNTVGVSGSSMGQPKHEHQGSLKVADTRSAMPRFG